MPRKRKKGLSERQKKILEVLETFQDENGYPPSIREICAEADISSTSVVNYYLEQLEEMGYIERDRRISRGVRLLKPLEDISQSVKQAAERASELLQIPIVGRITAGELSPVPSSDFAYYDAESKIEIPPSQLPGREKGKDLFALEVDGDSMIDAMVNDGDIIILKPTHEARNGEMVAIWRTDEDETTLKYFFKENGQVRLQPANPTMEPIIIQDPSDLEIRGKVVMVIRQVSGLQS
ncbi:MAG: transcriptional repressor LexA [Chloroflexota bacterium]|nr:MAG: transcriptional repressor LexA [Chloroflexota bacterium]